MAWNGLWPVHAVFRLQKGDYYGIFFRDVAGYAGGTQTVGCCTHGENAFEEEESFDELPVPPVIRSSVQPLNQAAPSLVLMRHPPFLLR